MAGVLLFLFLYVTFLLVLIKKILPLAFPPEIMATGFLSRILLIYGEPTGERITFPTDATQEVKEAIKKELQEIKQQVSGRAQTDSEADTVLDEIYKQWKRFTGYTIQDLFKPPIYSTH